MNRRKLTKKSIFKKDILNQFLLVLSLTGYFMNRKITDKKNLFLKKTF